jgi:hypothetical protein
VPIRSSAPSVIEEPRPYPTVHCWWAGAACYARLHRLFVALVRGRPVLCRVDDVQWHRTKGIKGPGSRAAEMVMAFVNGTLAERPDELPQPPQPKIFVHMYLLLLLIG